MKHATVIAAAIAASLLALGCEDLSSFTTAEDEVYRGYIIQPEEVRKGFGKFSVMQLALDMDAIETAPGTLRIESKEESEEGELVFEDVPLGPIPSLRYDALSNLDFPTGRLKNCIMIATVSGGRFTGADALIVISLMSDGKVEARVISGQDRLYGIFLLIKEKK